jgi:hypothetical protein
VKDFDAVAELFYGGDLHAGKASAKVDNPSLLSTPAPSGSQPDRPDSPQKQAAPAQAESPAASEARLVNKFYDPGSANGPHGRLLLGESINQLRDHFGLNEEATENHRRQYAEVVCAPLRFNPDEAQDLHRFVTRHLTTEDPTDEQIQEWAKASRKLLRERYGEEANERAKLVDQYIAENEGLSQTLGAAGLDVHPRIVSEFAERVWRAKQDGRWKPKGKARAL